MNLSKFQKNIQKNFNDLEQITWHDENIQKNFNDLEQQIFY